MPTSPDVLCSTITFSRRVDMRQAAGDKTSANNICKIYDGGGEYIASMPNNWDKRWSWLGI